MKKEVILKNAWIHGHSGLKRLKNYRFGPGSQSPNNKFYQSQISPIQSHYSLTLFRAQLLLLKLITNPVNKHPDLSALCQPIGPDSVQGEQVTIGFSSRHLKVRIYMAAFLIGSVFSIYYAALSKYKFPLQKTLPRHFLISNSLNYVSKSYGSQKRTYYMGLLRNICVIKNGSIYCILHNSMLIIDSKE